MTSREQRLLNDITKRIQQSFINRVTEVELGEAVHQNVAVANTKLIDLHNRKYEQIVALKSLVDLMTEDWADEEELINHYQAIEGHAYETMADSKAIMHDWQNIQTVLDNMAAIHQIEIDKLKAQQ